MNARRFGLAIADNRQENNYWNRVGVVLAGKRTMNDSASLTLPAPALDRTAANDKWLREYQAFLQLKPQLLATHSGQFVVVHNGQVVDSGPDEVALALRFFRQHGNVPIHIGLLTAAPESAARIPHYRQARPGDEG